MTLTESPALCDVAFKEWAAICAALASGRQTMILRKGGIHESGGRFLPEHLRFWLYPTRFHQDQGELIPEGEEFLRSAETFAPRDGRLNLRLHATVEDMHIFGEADLPRIERLAGLHLWSDETVRKRFAYRKPGLTLLFVRIQTRTEPHPIEMTPAYEGCKTWVQLTDSLPEDNLHPVLSDAEFAERHAEMRRRVTSV